MVLDIAELRLQDHHPQQFRALAGRQLRPNCRLRHHPLQMASSLCCSSPARLDTRAARFREHGIQNGLLSASKTACRHSMFGSAVFWLSKCSHARGSGEKCSHPPRPLAIVSCLFQYAGFICNNNNILEMMVVSDGIAFNADVGALYTLCSMYLIGVTGPLAPMRWNKEQWCSRSDMGWSVRHPPVTTTDSLGVFTSRYCRRAQLPPAVSTVVNSCHQQQ